MFEYYQIRHVCSLYERALSAAGLEFRSDKLWEDYINWEMKHKNLPLVTALYDRLLKAPTQLYSQHFERFVRFFFVIRTKSRSTTIRYVFLSLSLDSKNLSIPTLPTKFCMRMSTIRSTSSSNRS